MLLSYLGMRDEITKKIGETRSRIERDEVSTDEMLALLSDLLWEREMIIEEVDDLREVRYNWVSVTQSYRDSMKLILSEVDEVAYNDLESVASRLNMKVGRLLNEMMSIAVEKRDDPSTGPQMISSKDLSHLYTDHENSIEIDHVKELVVNRGDLTELSCQVRFSHIKRLEFDVSVDERLFHEKVKIISHCSLVRFPRSFSKLLAYAKSSYCNSYEFVARAVSCS